MRIHLLSALVAVTTLATAQVQPGHALVASSTSAPRRATLLDVDLGNGKVATFGRFPADTLAPLAVGLDPATRDAVVALDSAGASLLVRLQFTGAAIRLAQVLGTIPGRVTDLGFGGDDWVLATATGAGGGLFAVPRAGGRPTRLAQVPRLTAMFVFRGGVVLIQSGLASPPTDPADHFYDLVQRKLVAGRSTFTGHKPVDITGFAELPTAVSHRIVAHTDGTMAISFARQKPQAMRLTPALPRGATRRVRLTQRLAALVLGGRAHPFLKRFRTFDVRVQPWLTVAGPLTGDPVDFAVAGEFARVVMFGEACPRGGRFHIYGTQPFVGNARFLLDIGPGTANAPAALALGSSESRHGALRLPFALPGGCELRVAPEVVVAVTTDRNGFVRTTVPIPANPRLVGSAFFAQGFQLQAGKLVASQGAAALIEVR